MARAVMPTCRGRVTFVVPVGLQNASDQAISGTLRMAVIDEWRVEPSGPVAFRVDRGAVRDTSSH